MSTSTVTAPDAFPELYATQADVLVIGGGFAGTWAALRASQLTPRVILVDKAYVGRSGASAMSGGVTTAPMRGDQLDAWAEEFIVRGGYTANQDWTYQFLEDQLDRVEDLIALGMDIVRADDGSIKRVRSRGMTEVRCLQFVPRAAIAKLRAEVVTAGVTVLDRVCIAELLTSDGQYPTAGRVTGALGFESRTGRPVVIRAGATILATGPATIKGKGNLVIENDTGDGVGLAARIGARFVDMEFSCSGTFSVLAKQYLFGNFNVAVAHGARLVNANGERFMERYDAGRLERGELSQVVAGFTKEILSGRGPVYIDLRGCDESYWQTLRTIRGKVPGPLLTGVVPDPQVNPLLIEPGWSIWANGESGLQIDLACSTSVPGLWAAGSVARNDAVGRHSSAGAPTAFAMVTGYRAGQTAALSRSVPEGAHSGEEELRLLEGILEPLGRSGQLSTDEVHRRIATTVGGLPELLVLSRDRIVSTIGRLADIEDSLGFVRVDSPHELVKWHEARNTLTTAKLVFLSMLERTESRDSFYREDYPFTDDENWLCWHCVRLHDNGSPIFERQQIPFETYRVSPSAKRRCSPSEIASIMQSP